MGFPVLIGGVDDGEYEDADDGDDDDGIGKGELFHSDFASQEATTMLSNPKRHITTI